MRACGLIVSFALAACVPGSIGAPPAGLACTDGAIPAAGCPCGGQIQTTGYCYTNTWQATMTPCAAPVFSPAGGTYSSSQSVTVSTATSGATLYCGNTNPPTAVCSSPVTVASSSTLYAIAQKANYTDSAVASASYIIAGTFPSAGNPDGSCTQTLPSQAQPADTTNPTAVIGSGSAASCTYALLSSAVSKGGIVTFNCGATPVTIPITSPLTPPVTNAYAGDKPVSTVIDGGNLVTLDGGGAVQIISWNHQSSFQVNSDTLTLQHLTLINGKVTGTQLIPPCPASGSISNTLCSQGYDDGEGGALFVQDGLLRVIDVTFTNNQAALLGPDTGGGAIYITAAHPAYIVSSSFLNNKASNAGALGMLNASAFIYNSLFDGNSAVGNGANNDNSSNCTCINNGQHETGSGGNGGAIYKDGGDGASVTICGTQIRNNSSNEFGAAVFFTCDGNSAGQIVIEDSLLKNNTSPVDWQWCVGVSTDNPHGSGSSPIPVNSSFCDANGICQSTCSS